MGYNLYITRKENWGDEDGPSIRLEEWMTYIASEPIFASPPTENLWR